MALAKEQGHHDRDKKLKSMLKKAGFNSMHKIGSTLQGNIWKAIKASNDQNVVIKVTRKDLHQKAMTKTIDHNAYKCNENILMEARILKYLSETENMPPSIVKYITFLESKSSFFLVMEHGGSCLFDFVQKSHRMILSGQMMISGWHTTCRFMFKQCIDAVQFIHSHSICHFDLSLENFLISDNVAVEIMTTDKNNAKKVVGFVPDSMQIKLCDFGLADIFGEEKCLSSKFCGKLYYRSPEIATKTEEFDAKKNDIWALGVCLFMMLMGCVPWSVACKTDPRYNLILDGHLVELLEDWDKIHYVDNYSVDLLQKIFREERGRITLDDIEHHPWLRMDA